MIEILAFIAVGAIACLAFAHGLACIVDFALHAVDELRLLLAGAVDRVRSFFRR